MNWQTIFACDENSRKAVAIGQRLGVPYTRTLLPQIEVTVKNNSIGINEPEIIRIDQDGMGMIAISGVIWDCGLYLADFLCSSHIVSHIDTSYFEDEKSVIENLNTVCLESVLDIGCGTGICGVVAGKLGAKLVVFTDAVFTDAFEANLDMMLQQSKSHVEKNGPQSFHGVKWTWSKDANDEIPLIITHGCKENGELLSQSALCWSTVLCSDVLYEKSNLPALQLLLKRLSFYKMILAYKKRHDEAEQAFFEELSTWCHIFIVPKESIEPINLPTRNVDENLFVLVVVPFCFQAITRNFL